MVNKKLVIIVTIIALIVVGGLVYIGINNLESPTYTFENVEIAENNEMKNQNITEENNEVEPENIVGKEEAESEEEAKKAENTTSKQNQEQKESEEANKQNEEKALKLVKDEWGEDETVYYTVDNFAGGIYNISVRSKETTESLAEYKVNLGTNSVELK